MRNKQERPDRILRSISVYTLRRFQAAVRNVHWPTEANGDKTWRSQVWIYSDTTRSSSSFPLSTVIKHLRQIESKVPAAFLRCANFDGSDRYISSPLLGDAIGPNHQGLVVSRSISAVAPTVKRRQDRRRANKSHLNESQCDSCSSRSWAAAMRPER